MKMSNNSGSARILCLALCIALAQSITVRNGAYDSFVIEISKDVGEEECSQFLGSLEKLLTSSSEHLHAQLDGRILFNSIDIILPPAWPNTCVTNGTVTSYNGAPTDVQITRTHPIFGDDLWTQQSGGCGERGDQIFVSERAIRDAFENVDKKFTTEFMKYRYGVFDTSGFDGDAIYPKCSAASSALCSDAAALETAGAYNKYAPTKQNQLCDRRSRMDVVLRNEDFNSTQRSTDFYAPTFNYVRKMSTRYTIVVDDHADIAVRDSYAFLRDALRKWLDKDLSHRGTEVGIARVSAVDAAPSIRAIASTNDADEVLAALPFTISNRFGFGRCNIASSIERSIGLMRDRVKVHGDAISAIVLVAPGMYNCSEEVMSRLVERALEANVKFVTVNYPRIGLNRVPMDELAVRTGGQAFTVIERKSNEERSLLTTFFELTNVFMEISALYHHGDASDLPVEIYRKELRDTNPSGDSTKPRTYTDSFSVDDATRTIHFYLYYYDRKDIAMFIDNMTLTSPNQNTFTVYTELRSDYHQLTFVSNLSGAGSWHYNVKRFAGPLPHFVQVLAHPKLDARDFIRARAWTRRTGDGVVVLYVEVRQGLLPINDALVEAVVTAPSGKESRLQLFDSGSGEPDITRGDGIYTRYFLGGDAGMYQFAIRVSDNGNTAYVQMERDPTRQIHCCGSSIATPTKQPVTPFTRNIAPLTIFLDQAEVDASEAKRPSLGRIGDLRVVAPTANGSERVALEWTAPDTGSDDTPPDYEIRYALTLKDIVDSFETLAMPWPLAEPIPHTIGQGASATLNLHSEPSLVGVPFYVAVRSGATVSNFVRVFVPKRRPTASPTYTHVDSDLYETDPAMQPADADEPGLGIFARHAAIPWPIVVPVAACALLLLLLAVVYCWCCAARKRSYGDAKKPTSPSKPAISVIAPSSPAAQPNQYHVDPVNGSVHGYLVDAPDHHTVGLPTLDDDLFKPDFGDHDKMLIEEMRQQQRFQQQALIDAYGDQPILTRNGHYLSPYESWSASTLLHEHEVRQSPTGHDGALLYVDANGDIAPPVPPHPYAQHQQLAMGGGGGGGGNGTYGYAGDAARAPPPQYSSVYRPLVRGLPGQGSMQSVVSSAMMSNGDAKKIRNVTMV